MFQASASFTPFGDAESLLDELRSAVREGVAEATDLVRDAARTKAPVLEKATKERHPGELRDSIQSQVIENGNVITGVVSAGAFYARWNEFGTVHQRARPFMRPALDINKERAAESIGNRAMEALK